MQSSYQYHFGGSNPIFGGVDWGSGAAAGGSFSIGNLVQEVGVHEKNASCVKEFAYTEDKNFRFRPSMEDSKLQEILVHFQFINEDLNNIISLLRKRQIEWRS